MQVTTLSITTDSSGDGSATTPVLNGLLRRIAYVKTDFADGVDFTLTDGFGTTLLTGTNVNASAAYHPRQATHGADGSASLYAASGEPVESDYPVSGTLTVTVSSGGDTKSGTFHIWVG